MADDLEDRGAQDRSRINVNEDDELRYGTQKWGVSKEQLTAAVQKAGVSVDAIARELGRMKIQIDDFYRPRTATAGGWSGTRGPGMHCAPRAQPGLRRSCHRDPYGGLAGSHRYQPRERGAAVDAGKIRRRKTD